MNTQFELLETLCNEPGITGFESAIAEIVRNELKDVCDDIKKDKLGSIICSKNGEEKGPNIMLAAHMDEVGYMVDHLYEDGFISYHYVGGWDPCQQLGMRVVIHTKKGLVPGVIAVKNRTSSDWSKPMLAEDLYLDVGACSKKELIEMGIKIGDIISADYLLKRMANPNVLMSKAFDCRAGVGIMVEVMKAAKEFSHPNTLYGVGTVQEEVGCRGAKTSAAVVKPDLCIAIDTAGAGDTLGYAFKCPERGLGKGPIIVVMDHAMITNPLLREWVINLAEELNIPHQVIYLDGGSFDTSAVHLYNDGVPSIAIAVPTRYVHTTGSIINFEDYLNTIRLVSEIVKRLDKKTIEGFWNY